MSKCVMIVDDQRHSRTLLMHTLAPLEDAGVELCVAEDAQQALQIATEQTPDIVFADATMLGLRGYDLCKRLRGIPSVATTYILLVGEKGQEPDEPTLTASGANDFITKPFDPEQILLRTSELLGIEVMF